MPFDAHDVDIFVLTYNRADLLPATLRSLLSQSAQGASITVLDNASTDDTTTVLQPFLDVGVRHERAENNLGWAGNLARAQTMARRPWTMVFHDDDLLHPQYLAYALQAINDTSNLGVVASAMSFETSPVEDGWSTSTPLKTLCGNVGELAALLYEGFALHFGAVIYRTEILRGLKWESDLYGKIADRPFVLAAAEHHATVVFRSPLVRYRLHANQDSTASTSGPFAPQLAALHRCYRRYIGENPLSRQGRTFLCHNYRSIRDEFPRLADVDKGRFPSLQGYIDFIKSAGGCSRFSVAVGRLTVTLNPLLRIRTYSHALLRRIRS